MKNKNKLKAELLNYALDKIKDGVCDDCYMCDVANEIFNSDYYIIGHYYAEQWIIENFESVFTAIQDVFEYELENFGEICTKEINAESICNMLVYIHGCEFLDPLLSDLDDRLTEATTAQLIEVIEKELTNEL